MQARSAFHKARRPRIRCPTASGITICLEVAIEMKTNLIRLCAMVLASICLSSCHKNIDSNAVLTDTWFSFAMQVQDFHARTGAWPSSAHDLCPNGTFDFYTEHVPGGPTIVSVPERDFHLWIISQSPAGPAYHYLISSGTLNVDLKGGPLAKEPLTGFHKKVFEAIRAFQARKAKQGDH